jgi:hypothetical protein
MKEVIKFELQLRRLNKQIKSAINNNDAHLVAGLYRARTEVLLSLVEAQRKVINGRFSWLAG